MSEKTYPCPCCGHVVFEEPPGSDDICLVCFWQDDVMQLRWPQLGGSANAVSLEEAQRNFLRLGASEARFSGDVRPPAADEPLDSTWRPIDPSDAFEAPDDSAPWPDDSTTLYYWRRTFWRSPHRRN
ncbi:MAG TPA: CPCC family cysteine-rich protein [Polyangiaceae bacterium]|nr:CPCC family cysteine-rich protein [Polyangiaceae bacterium]